MTPKMISCAKIRPYKIYTLTNEFVPKIKEKNIFVFLSVRRWYDTQEFGDHR